MLVTRASFSKVFRQSVSSPSLRFATSGGLYSCTCLGHQYSGHNALLSHSRFASSVAKKTPYAVLGVKRTATKEEIKKAYRVMARKHHPDAPGGDHQKFQEIQEAYEQIKTGVWIDKGNGGSSGDGGENGSSRSASVYSSLRYRTRTHKSANVSYEDFYTEMHTGKVKKNPFEDEENEKKSASKTDEEKNSREALFAAWFRFITLWCIVFVSFRVTFFAAFPPVRKEKPKKPPLPAALRTPNNRPATLKPTSLSNV